MNISPNNVVPLGSEFLHRTEAERLSEEIYRAIPALNSLTTSALQVSNKLGYEAREALFHSKNLDVGLRALKVEVAIERQASVTPTPDMEWLKGAASLPGNNFRSSALQEDDWLKPEAP